MLMISFNSMVELIFSVTTLAFALVALVFAALAREDAYRAADKQTKSFWLIILGVTLAVDLFINFLVLQLAGLIACIVFMVDVRPALRQVSGGGRRGSSSDGPYGPYNGGR